MSNRRQTHRHSRYFVTLPGVFLSIALAAPAITAGEEQQQQQQQQQQQRGASGQQGPALVPVATAGEVAGNPALYYGRPVSVHAEVENVLGPNWFTLDEDNIGAQPDVLVFIPNRAPGAILPDAEDTYVTVVGHVRPFVTSQFEREFGWFGLNDRDLLMRFRSRPLIVAETARTSTGVMLAQGTDGQMVLVTNPGRILDVPGRFYGRRVLIPDASVEERIGLRAFKLDDPAFFSFNDLTVIAPRDVAANVVAEDETVTVRGTVRRYVADEFERDYDWFDASGYTNVSDIDGRPVVVADYVRGETGVEVTLLDIDWVGPTRFTAENWGGFQDWQTGTSGQMAQQPGQQQPPRQMQGQPPQGQARPGTTGEQAVGTAGMAAVTDVSRLVDARGIGDLAGRDVDLQTVMVRRAVGSRIILVGPSDERTVAVRIPQNATAPQSGSIRLNGTVREVPMSLDGWNLTQEERNVLRDRAIFIDANAIKRVQ